MRIKQIIESKSSRLFIILSGFFIANAVVAEFVGVKIFSLEKTLAIDVIDWSFLGYDGSGFNLSAGVLMWPVVFIMTDIINEYFGPKSVRLLSFLAVGLIFYSFLMVFGTIQLAPNDWWQNEAGMLNPEQGEVSDMNAAYARIMGQGVWITIGSITAFLVGQLVDVFIFHKIKRITGEKKIWLRATGSTLVSQLVDSYVVALIAFWIGAGWDVLWVLAISSVNYLYKFAVAVIVTPVIYLAHHLIDRYLGKDKADEMKKEAAGVDFEVLS